MADSTTWQSAADEFWRSVRALVRQNEKTPEQAADCVSHYRRLLQAQGVSEGLVFHRGVEAAAQAAVANSTEVAYR